MIALKDALDHYLISHPDSLLERPHEASTCDPENRNIAKKHLVCAAAEVYLTENDAVYPARDRIEVIGELENEGKLRRGRNGALWFSGIRMPQREVGIRSIGTPLKLKNEYGRPLGELDGRRIYRDAFPGAIYLHRGRQYQVLHLDIERGEAVCREVGVEYYTQALSGEQEIRGNPLKAPAPLSREVELYHGPLRITYRVTGYQRKHLYHGTRLSTHAVAMPEYVFDTEGVWMVVHKSLEARILSGGHDLPGTLHAAEHVAIAGIPLFSLCDKGDIGGVSYSLHPDFRKPAIFIYDGYEGGIGLTKRVLDIPDEWIRSSREIIRECECEDGCPSCVQDSQCGSANTPLDKKGAFFFLGELLK